MAILNSKVKISVCFLDETGLLNRPEDRFFALGIIKTSKPESLYNPLQYLRDKNKFYDEIKWKNVSAKNYPMLIKVLGCFWENKEAKFAAVILDKKQLDFQTYFANNFWQVYESFTALLLRGNVSKDEELIVLADYYPSPKNNCFEQNIKTRVNLTIKRAALLTVCRLNSRSSDLLQLADLFLGAVVYDLKLKYKLIDKPSRLNRKLLREIKKRLGVKNFCESLKNQKLNILLFTGNKKPQIMGHSTNT